MSCRARKKHGSRALETRSATGSFPYHRRLRFEPLEDRRLLSITVDTLIDVNANDGLTTLREAIAAAPSGETIDFSVTGTINLSSLGQLTINKSLTINGPGASLLTIRAFDPSAAVGNGTRVFNVDDGNFFADKTVALSGLTLTGGDVSDVSGDNGGAVKSKENLTVTDSTINGNSARDSGGGIGSFGNLTVTNSTISGNSTNGSGGGIGSFGNLTVTNSTISGNTATSGGGILINTGDLLNGYVTLVVGSTISGNTAANGGGIFNAAGLTVIQRSTITHNTALAGQGSGIASFGDTLPRTEVHSTIVAGNNSSDVDFVFDSTNSFQSNGYNLIGTGNATGEFVEPGDQTGVANPMLGPLADNGGPTKSHALLAGSPAIDMGDPAIVFNPAEFDQRGNPFVRVFDGDGDATARIDVGSYERQSANGSIVVDTLVDEDDDDYSAGDLSLREAIGLAHAFVGAETITFDASLAGGTIVLTLGELTIHDSMTINGLGADLLTIDASGNDPTPLVNNGDGSRVFTIDDGDFTAFPDKAISISGLTLTGGDVSGFFFGIGGAILSREDLSIASCTISGNSAANYGGGIYNSGGNLTVTNSTISGNSTTGSGGAIGTNGNLLLTHSTLSGNSAAKYGGGIFSVTNLTGMKTTTISNSTISGNSAATSGGGIYNFDGLTVIRHSTITNNTAPVGQGSGIASFGDTATRTEVHSTIIAGNTNSNVDFVFVGNNTFQSNGYNLIGAGNATGEFVEPGDQTGVTNPKLGPLADNGGPTKSHALLVGSPAIDLGDPAIAFNPTEFDQRGDPFVRVSDGDGDATARIDIGSYERQTLDASNFVVDTLSDENDGDYSPGDRSLREAIGLARGSVGVETITFAAALTGGGPASIVLTQDELRIADSLTIDGPGANLLTIDASGNDPTPALNNGDGSRVLNIDNGSIGGKIDVEIVGLTLTGGDVNGVGGGIRTFAEDLSIVGVMIRDNSATAGGGIHNTGGIGEVVTVASSTISGNSAGTGGGIYNQGDNLTVTNSTISGNAAKTHGGGMSTPFGTVRLAHSTITGNVADSDQNNSGQGGGIAIFNNPYYGSVNVTLDHTIVAGNIRGASTRSDIAGPIGGARYSLIGDNTGASIVNNGGNQIGTSALPIDPMLGPLADNAGPTLTHALLAGSPAIDMGDTAALAGVLLVPLFDQRGEPFTRVYDGDAVPGTVIDIGALELQPLPAAFFGDYNQNGVVDAADYVVWRKTLGTAGIQSYSGADGDGDGTIDSDDYSVWRPHFGQVLPVAGAGNAMVAAATALPAQQPPALPGVGAAAAIHQGELYVAVDAVKPPADFGELSRAEPGAAGVAVVGRQAQPDLLGIAFAEAHAGPKSMGAIQARARAGSIARTLASNRDDALIGWLDSNTEFRRRDESSVDRPAGSTSEQAATEDEIALCDDVFELLAVGSL